MEYFYNSDSQQIFTINFNINQKIVQHVHKSNLTYDYVCSNEQFLKRVFYYQIDKSIDIFLTNFHFLFSDFTKLYYVSSTNYEERKEMDRKRDI